jgi:hypothetical protein
MLSSQPLFIEPQRCGRITAISSAIQRKPMVLAPDREVEIAAPQIALARASQDAQQSRASQGALRSEIAELRPVMAQAEREANECASAATRFKPKSRRSRSAHHGSASRKGGDRSVTAVSTIPGEPRDRRRLSCGFLPAELKSDYCK